MWRNLDVAALIEWMRRYNERVPDLDRLAGFYGLDIYNMSGSIAAVLEYLEKVDPEAAAVARERYGCLTPWQKEPETYGRAVLTAGYRKCEQAVIQQCRDLLQCRLDYAAQDGEGFLDAAQNAWLVASAERYYASCTMAARSRGTCATRTCSRRFAICSKRAGRDPRRSCGRITRT
jgi:erythromycin esterase-like protein